MEFRLINFVKFRAIFYDRFRKSSDKFHFIFHSIHVSGALGDQIPLALYVRLGISRTCTFVKMVTVVWLPIELWLELTRPNSIHGFL